MIYRDPAKGNDHNLVIPQDQLMAQAYKYVGDIGPQPWLAGANCVGVAVGPRLVCRVSHTPAETVQMNFRYDGQDYRIIEVIPSPSQADAVYLKLDRDLPFWAPVWRYDGDMSKFTAQTRIFYVCTGPGRGAEIHRESDGLLIGWYTGGWPTAAKRWALGVPSEVNPEPSAG